MTMTATLPLQSMLAGEPCGVDQGFSDATGAMARRMSPYQQPTKFVKMPPALIPVANTRLVSTQYFDSISPTSASKNAKSMPSFETPSGVTQSSATPPSLGSCFGSASG